ncbi:MAG TPA: hypothetical protein V6C58_14085 [Allocoleopsis sp.]
MDTYIKFFKTTKFIGVQPITFSRFVYDSNKDYFMTLKLDGLRKILIINDKGKSYFFTSKMDIQRGKYNIKELKNSVFDGEYFKGKYYIFDVLVINGIDVRKEIFSNRIKILENIDTKILGNIKIKKHYYSSDRLRLFRYLKKKISKNVDGIIFTPNSYYFESPLKWKPTNMLSIDFKIKKLPDNKFYLLTQSGKVFTSKKFKINGIVKVTTKDYLKYPDLSVVEFVYIKRKFIPIRHRRDKINSNHIRVILSNLDAITNPPNMSLLLK